MNIKLLNSSKKKLTIGVTFFPIPALNNRSTKSYFNTSKKTSIMKKLIGLAIAILVVTLFFTSCEQDNFLEDQELTNEEAALEAEADAIEAELSKEISLGGFEFMDRAEYEKLPVVAAEELPNLLKDEVSVRSGYRKLPTPPVVNQGREGSCVSFAVGYVGVSYYLNRLKNMPYTTTGAYRSPEFLYNNTKLSGSCDAGSNFVPVLNFLRTNGVCSWSQMPYSDVNGCASRGSSAQRSQALSGKIRTWTRLYNSSVSNLRSYLDRGYPILTGLQLDASFYQQTTSRNYNYTWRIKGGSNRGGHAVVITGYDDSRRAFIVQNSWGTSTHDRGFFYISYDLIPYLMLELYVINPVI